MSLFKKTTGNWAEDLGNDLHTLLWLGFASMIVVPVLVIIIIVLVLMLL